MNSIFFLIPLLANFILLVDGGKEKNYCNVCRAVVDEANWKVSQSDPKRTVQVGSFRVDPQGNQKIQEKNYARSESHIEEMFESICEQMSDYAELKQDDGSTTVVRTLGRNGERLDTKNVDFSQNIGKKLKGQCHDFLEDHEEVVMGLLQRDDIENYEEIICGKETGVCSGKELTTPMVELPEAQEEAFQPKDSEDGEEEEEEDTESEVDSTDAASSEEGEAAGDSNEEKDEL